MPPDFKIMIFAMNTYRISLVKPSGYHPSEPLREIKESQVQRGKLECKSHESPRASSSLIGKSSCS